MLQETSFVEHVKYIEIERERKIYSTRLCDVYTRQVWGYSKKRKKDEDKIDEGDRGEAVIWMRKKIIYSLATDRSDYARRLSQLSLIALRRRRELSR